MPLNLSSIFRYVPALLLTGFLISCGGKKGKPLEETPARIVKVPLFNSDSAYLFTESQVAFGPRVPNTHSHDVAGDYLISKLKKYGASVTVQQFEATSFDGYRLKLSNIIAAYYPEKQKRILLAAHWDTRPFADKDAQTPEGKFDGANDGASGVSVLLEVARVLKNNAAPDVGVDIILFDGEDWGEKDKTENKIPLPSGLNSWWCLGSQHWSKNKHRTNYSAYYGILVDMVGAQDAHFFQEGYSLEYAPRIVDKVWGTASRLGYSSTFVRQKESAITDDHVYVNVIGKIPMIDIVHFDPVLGYFGDFHHTRKDAMTLISKETLGMVGNVLLNVVYFEE